ncbi:MAG: hypothetical protein AAFX94_12125, partial [Myxococcota bacterium]
IAELERQLGSLRRQARKAERYRELRGELRDLELHAASTEMLKMAAVERFQLAERKKLEARLTDTQGAMATGEATVEADKLRLVEEERRLQDEQQASAEIDAKLAALERDLEHWHTQATEAQARAEQGERDATEAGARAEAAEQESKQLAQQVEVLSGSFGSDQDRLEAMALGVDDAQAAVVRADEQIERLRAEAVEQIHGAAQHRSMLSTLERQRADTDRRLDQATREVEVVTERRVELRQRLESLAVEISAREAALAGWRSELDLTREQRAGLREDIDEIAARAQSLRDELSARRSRLSSLEEITRRLEGFSDGVRTLMGQDGEPVIDGVQALVPEILEVPAEFEVAFEAALGDRLQYLIVDDHGVARRGIDHLRQVDGGRGGFVPAQPWPSQPNRAVGPGIRGTALELVTVKAGFDAAAAALLDDIVIVDSLDVALGEWPGPRPRLVVTLSGEVVDDRGAVIGGVDEGSGVLANRREIRELSELVAELEASLERERAVLAEREEQAASADARIETLDGSIRQGELERVEQQKDLEAAREEQRRLEDRNEVLRYELEQHREELARIEQEDTSTKATLAELDATRGRIEGEVTEAQEERRRLAEALDARTQELTRLRVDLAA